MCLVFCWGLFVSRCSRLWPMVPVRVAVSPLPCQSVSTGRAVPRNAASPHARPPWSSRDTSTSARCSCGRATAGWSPAAHRLPSSANPPLGANRESAGPGSSPVRHAEPPRRLDGPHVLPDFVPEDVERSRGARRPVSSRALMSCCRVRISRIACRRVEIGTRRACPVFVLSAGSQSSGRRLSCTCDHCRVSNSPFSTAGFERGLDDGPQMGTSCSQQPLLFPGLQPARGATSRQLDGGHGPPLERRPLDVSPCPDRPFERRPHNVGPGWPPPVRRRSSSPSSLLVHVVHESRLSQPFERIGGHVDDVPFAERLGVVPSAAEGRSAYDADLIPLPVARRRARDVRSA